MEAELIAINVWLAGRSYRIRIQPSEEEVVRKAVKVADEKIRDMATHYAGKDDQDFIAMVLLMYAANAVTENRHDPLLKQELQGMIDNIDKALGE